jgi:hypothetical protein
MTSKGYQIEDLDRKYREGFTAGMAIALAALCPHLLTRVRAHRKKLAALKHAAPMSKEYADAKRGR